MLIGACIVILSIAAYVLREKPAQVPAVPDSGVSAPARL